MLPLGAIAASRRRAGGGGGAPNWTPADLPSAKVGWYDADQQTEGDGNAVATFVNRFGNSAFDFVSIGSNPILRHNRVNGKKALEFGSGKGLQVSSANSMLNGATSCCLFMVVKGVSDPSAGGGPDEAPLNGFGTGGASHFYTDGRWYESFGTSSRRDVDPPTSWASSFRIAAVESAAGNFKMWWDATAIISQASNTVATGTSNRRMGDREGGAGTYAGDIAEVVICSALLSTANKYRMAGYLAFKYGLTANLPADHPFYNATATPTTGPFIRYPTQNISTTAAANVAPYYVADGAPSFALAAGTLPPGLSLNSSTGAITGTPTTLGTYAGIQVSITDGAYTVTSAAFTLEVVTGFRYFFQEFLTSGNNFQGMSTIKLIDGGAVNRALASSGASISAVGYTVNGSFPVSNAIDGNDATFTTSASASAGAGKGQLVDLGALYDIDKWGYRSRSDSFGDTEAITSGKLWARVAATDPWTLVYTISEGSWADNEYRERTI